MSHIHLDERSERWCRDCRPAWEARRNRRFLWALLRSFLIGLFVYLLAHWLQAIS